MFSMPARHIVFSCSLCIALLATIIWGQEPKLADLIGVERIQSLTLSELGWEEQSREVVGDVLHLTGKWTGPSYWGFDASESEQTTRLELSERARVWIPRAQPQSAEVSQIVWGVHVDEGTRDVPWSVCLDLPSRLPVAILRHAQMPEDWSLLGFRNRDDWLFSWWFEFLRKVNPCQPTDYRHSNYLVSLVETQLMSITLLSRLLEAQGYEPGPAATGGISKEGWAAWLSAAVDDRIAVAAPGSFHFEDILQGFSSSIAEGGCSYAESALRTAKWFEATAAGQTALEYFSVPQFATYLKAELLLVFGDVGLFGMHDGRYFATGMETQFLENFSAVPFRYDRLPDFSGEVTQDPGDTRETYDGLRSRQINQLAHYLLTGDAATHPKVVGASVETGASSFRARARVEPEASSVRLWWSHSENRTFREPGNALWVSVEMAPDGDSWVSPSVDIPLGTVVGWYVEAENTLEWESLTLAQRDTSPQRFFNEREPLSCPTSAPDCWPPDPPTGLEAVGEDSRVRLNWEDNTEADLRGYTVTRSELPDGVYEILATELGKSEYTDTDVVNGTTYYYKVTASDVLSNQSGPSPYVEATPVATTFRRGDCNDDGSIDLSDAVCILGWLFVGEAAPACVAATNVDGAGPVEISDPIYLLTHLYLGGPAPRDPFPDCGPRASAADEALGCDTAPASCQEQLTAAR